MLVQDSILVLWLPGLIRARSLSNAGNNWRFEATVQSLCLAVHVDDEGFEA